MEKGGVGDAEVEGGKRDLPQVPVSYNRPRSENPGSQEPALICWAALTKTEFGSLDMDSHLPPNC